MKALQIMRSDSNSAPYEDVYTEGFQSNPFSNAKNQLSKLSSQAALIPYENEVHEALRVSENLDWQKPEFLENAVESAKGLVLAVINNIPKQVEMHLKELEYMGNLNKAEVSVNYLSQFHEQAKPFAVCESAQPELEIKGHGYTWHLSSILFSEDAIPSCYLERLTAIRASGYEPDSLYVAVPFAGQKRPLPIAIRNEAKNIIDAVSYTVTKVNKSVNKAIEKAKQIKLPDPVLIAGFGKNPIVLVEIGRWV